MGQALIEQRSFWRSAEYALFTFVFPLMILLLTGAVNVGSYLPGTHIKNTPVLVPGILAFGVIVAAYVNLGSKVPMLSWPPRSLLAVYLLLPIRSSRMRRYVESLVMLATLPYAALLYAGPRPGPGRVAE